MIKRENINISLSQIEPNLPQINSDSSSKGQHHRSKTNSVYCNSTIAVFENGSTEGEETLFEQIIKFQIDVTVIIEQIYHLILDKKYLLSKNAMYKKTLCKHTAVFASKHLNQIDNISKMLSARMKSMNLPQLESTKLFLNAHQLILKSSKAFCRYFRNVLDHTNVIYLSNLIERIDGIADMFMKHIHANTDHKCFVSTEKLLKRIHNILEITKKSNKNNCMPQLRKTKNQSTNGLGMYGTNLLKCTSIKTKARRQITARSTKTTKIMVEKKSKQVVFTNKGAKIIKDGLKSNKEEQKPNCNANRMMQEFNQLKIKMFEEINALEHKLKNDPFSNSLTENKSLAKDSDETELKLEADKIICTKLKEPMTNKNEIYERIENPAKNVQFTHIIKNTDETQDEIKIIQPSDKPTQQNNAFQIVQHQRATFLDTIQKNSTHRINGFEIVQHQRATFLNDLQKNTLYQNKNFKEPWRTLSKISEVLLSEIIYSIFIYEQSQQFSE